MTLIDTYYSSWNVGKPSVDEAVLRRILAPDLHFQGVMAPEVRGADGFLQGLRRFVGTVKSMRFVARVESGGDVATLYDCDLTMPAQTVRFAEFFHVEDDRIQAIRIAFDASEHRKLAAERA